MARHIYSNFSLWPVGFLPLMVNESRNCQPLNSSLSHCHWSQKPNSINYLIVLFFMDGIHENISSIVKRGITQLTHSNVESLISCEFIK